MAAAKTDRNRAIGEAVRAGYTYRQIAEQVDVGEQRVGQIARQLGIKPIRRPAPNAARNAQMWNLRQQGMSYAAIGDRFGVSGTRARAICLLEAERSGS